MSRQRIALILGVILVCVRVNASEYHDFQSADGNSTVRAKIIDFDARTGMLRVQKEQGGTVRVNKNVFSEADQKYIMEWNLGKAISSESQFKIDLKKTRLDKEKKPTYQNISDSNGNVEKTLMKTTTFEKMAYDVALQNKNAVPLKNIRVEYIIYYEQSEESWEKPKVKQKKFKGKAAVSEIQARGIHKLTTDSVKIFEDSINSIDWTSGKTRTGGKGDIHGIRLRVYMKMASGKEVMREASQPKTLSEKDFPWE